MPTTTTIVTETTTATTVPPPLPQPQQDISTSILIQTIGQLEQNIADLVEANQALEEKLDKQGNMIHQLESQDLSRLIREQTMEFIDSHEIDQKIEESVKEVVIASVQHAMRAPLRARFKDLPTSDMKEILLQRMLEENYDKGHEDHKMAYEALQKSIIRDESEKFDADKAEERTKKKSTQDSPKTPPGSPPSPPPPPPPSGASGASYITGASDSAQDPPPPPPSSTTNRGDKYQISTASGSSKTTALTEYIAWTTTTSRLKPDASSVPEDVLMHEESDFEAQDMGSDDEDSGSRHIPKVSLNQEWFKPLSEKERHATPEPAWSIPSLSLPVPNNNWASALASVFVPPPKNSLLSQTGDIRVFIDWFCKKQGITELTPEHLEDEGLLRYNLSRPLPLGGPPGQVTIQTEFFFNKDLEYLRFGHKGDRLALSITKMKAASYSDAGLEQMVPDQMWAEEEYMTYMRILSVIRIEVFSLYGYDYMKKIVLRRADNQEYTIAESDFKDLYQSDFEDLYLLNLQGHLNHLPPKDKKILSTAVNLWIRNLEATGLEFMHEYKILDSPRAVVFKDRYGMQMIMRFNEIHKFSDGTLQQIDEALDYRVKEFKVNKVNPGLNTRFWTKNDVIKSKQFMFAIQKRLKLRRIFRNLESFVGGRIREGDYRLLQRTE
ncbi:hypothetical protein Tco_1063138 [Tanacetum coccineum]